VKTITIKGMTCQHCVMAVTKALDEIEGIENVTVDLEKGEAVFDETVPVSMEIVEEQIRNAGYEIV
jgi:copper chaperone